MHFHNNRYRVARGDLNFANPFRLDPVINVEATTNIQQYEITLNFSGQSSKLSLLLHRSDPPVASQRHHHAARAGTDHLGIHLA